MDDTDQHPRSDDLNELIQEQIRTISNEASRHLESLPESPRQSWLNRRNSALNSDSVLRFQSDVSTFFDDDAYPAYTLGNSHLTYDAEYRRARESKSRAIDVRRHESLTSLFAAEIEYHKRHRPTTNQSIELGSTFEAIGKQLLRGKLPLHAAFAFDRARRAYMVANDLDGRTRCLYGAAQAERQSSAVFCWRWFRHTALWMTAGYGFRPWRLLPWVAAQFTALTSAYTWVTRKSITDSLYTVAVNYINPSASDQLSRAGVFLTIDGYLGIITTSIFFALLIRHWFR